MIVALLLSWPYVVFAASYTVTKSENVRTYTTNIAKTYSRNNASTGWTGTTTTSSGSSAGYDDSYKTAYYYEYKDVDGEYVELYSNTKSGTSEIVKTNINHTVSSKAVRRKHITKLHRGSNSDSSIVEKITITVTKPS